MGLYERTKHKVRFWLLRRLPTCRDTVAVISEAMERRLTLRERFLLKLHLWVCMWCQWYLEHLKTMRDALRAEGPEPADLDSLPGLSPEARERLKKKVSGQ
jgi:hypothetical protein